jgi:ABC-type lipoprotein export system ATPase subunit/histidinol phosphatase-like PHP family hydrolase
MEIVDSDVTDPTAQRAGLQRVALDLHVHSPASHDWVGEPASAEQIVARAVEQGLDGIAITDHQCGEFVDKLRAAAEDTPLTIIPGIEINSLAGNDGIHLIALFELATTAKDIDLFLAAIDALEGTGANMKRVTSKKGIIEVLGEIRKRNGIAVLAHCQSSKGSLAEMRGDVRIELIRHPAVLAAEARAEEFFDEGKAAERKRTFDLLDGDDPSYKRKLAVYQASDNPAAGGGHGHDLSGIGSRFTYFYVEQPLTLESLRQCFVDRDARIEFPAIGERPAGITVVSPYIAKVEITGGFLDGLALDLHTGLTSVLGSKGSGKSVLIELIRFALDQSPEQEDIRRDHDTKLEKQLGLYGRAAVTIRDAGGSFHRIEREFDPANGSPFSNVTFRPAEFFPCHFLSQNEIIRLAESEQEQIKFIDSFFDFHAFRRDIDAARAELLGLDKEVADQIRARKRMSALALTQRTLQAQIAEKDKALSSPVFSRFQEAQAKKQALDRAVDAVAGFVAAAEVGKTALDAAPMPPEPAQALAEDQLLRQIADTVADGYKRAVALTLDTIAVLGKVKGEVEKERDEWMPSYSAISAQYTAEIRQIGGDRLALSQDRARLVTALERTEKDLRVTSQEAERLNPTVERRKSLLDTVEQRQADYTQARRERCDWFERQSDGQIRATVQAGSNYDEFCAHLNSLKRGSYLAGAEIETIARSIKPRAFVSALLRYDFARHERELQPIQVATELPIERIKVLAEFLLEDQDYERLLKIEHTATPTDRPEIRFRRNDGSYDPLNELSTGQKATAFLIMALCEGEIPIVVDQPEDSLDIRSIWTDMCLRLRRSKRSRQFLFTTHNSSLAVASDSDKFVVLAADARHAEVALSGALDGAEVRGHVIELLEGGEKTYFLKQRKYNVKDESHD